MILPDEAKADWLNLKYAADDLIHQICSRDLATGDLIHQIYSRKLLPGFPFWLIPKPEVRRPSSS